MESILRPYATAGIALVGASVIAVTPVVAPSPDVRVALPSVNLSAAVDPITPWIETINTATANAGNLIDSWLEAPAPVLQQVIANQLGYLGELPDLAAIATQMKANLQATVTALVGADESTLDDNGLLGHKPVWDLLPILVDIPENVQPILDFSTSYLSGVLLGLAGPVVGPALALAVTTQAIVDNLSSENPDLATAFNDLINIPATMTDAFLNGGQHLDLTNLVTKIGPSIGLELPEGTTIGIAFGGLLSPGGSIFNALDFGLAGIPVADGTGPGAIGSLIGLSKTIAKAIGWDGEGSPLDPAGPNTATKTADPADVPASVLNSKVPTVDATADATVTAKSTAAETVSVTTSPETSETTDTTVKKDEESADAAPAKAEENSATDEATTAKPAAKPKTPGSQLKTAIKSANDRLNSTVSDLGKKLKRDTKPSSTKTAETSKPSDNATGNDAKSSDAKGSDSKGGDNKD